MRVAFDIDGVFADMQGALEREARRLFQPGDATNPAEPVNAWAPEAEPQDVQGEPVAATLGLSEDQQRRLWREVLRIPDFWESLDEIEPGSVSRLAALAAARRWEVLFITNRPETAGASAQQQLQRWLQRQGFPSPSVFVVRGSRGKIAAALDLDVVVDDRRENCLDVVSESNARAIFVSRGDDDVAANARTQGIGCSPTVMSALDRLDEADRTPSALAGIASPDTVQSSEPTAPLSSWPREPNRTDEPTGGGAAHSPHAGTAANDAVASLVRALFLGTDEHSTRHVLFTSVDDSPGAVDVVIQVAVALAEQASQPVYLVDMDLNHPTLNTRLELDGRVGFSDAVTQGGELGNYAHEVESVANLWVMPAGLQLELPSRPTVRSHEAKLDFVDANTRTRIATLIDTPDYVIAYTAAIGSCSDAELIGRLFDGVVLVVQAGITTAEATKHAASALKASKARLLGTLLENRLRAEPTSTPARHNKHARPRLVIRY